MAEQTSPLTSVNLLAHPLKRLSLRCGSQVPGEATSFPYRAEVFGLKVAAEEIALQSLIRYNGVFPSPGVSAAARNEPGRG